MSALLKSYCYHQCAPAQASDRTCRLIRPDATHVSVMSVPIRVQGVKNLTGLIRSEQTECASESSQHSDLCRALSLLTPVYISRDLTQPLRVRSRAGPKSACLKQWPDALVLTSGRFTALSASAAPPLQMTGHGQPASCQDMANIRSLLYPPFSFSKSTTTSPLLPSC
jgi:hypothetical protein